MLNVLAPSELDTGDRVCAWREHVDINYLTDLPLDPTYDHEWTVSSVATNINTVRIYFADDTWMDFDNAARIVVKR